MKLTKTLLATAILGFSLTFFHSTAWADTPEQQFQQGFKAVERGDYQTALKLWIPLAEQGNTNAQLNLSLMYFDGKGVKQDVSEAMKWLQKSAIEGNIDSQFLLGNIYSKGKIVKQDHIEAVKWFRKAAEQGHSRSQTLLGVNYLLGNGVEKNIIFANNWLRKACDNGDKAGCEIYNEVNK